MILLHDRCQPNPELLSENIINVLRYSGLKHPISWAHRNSSGQKRAWRLWSSSPRSLQKAAWKKHSGASLISNTQKKVWEDGCEKLWVFITTSSSFSKSCSTCHWLNNTLGHLVNCLLLQDKQNHLSKTCSWFLHGCEVCDSGLFGVDLKHNFP